MGNIFSILDCGKTKILRLGEKVKYRTYTQERFELLPGQFIFASSMKKISLPANLAAFVEGRSSIGLVIRNAAWVAPGINLRHIGGIAQVDLINPGLTIGRNIQITVPDHSPLRSGRITLILAASDRRDRHIGKCPASLCKKQIRLLDLYTEHCGISGRILLIGKAVPLPVLPVNEIPIRHIASIELEGGTLLYW